MAHFSYPVGVHGPLVQVAVSPSHPKVQALQTAKQPVPAPAVAKMLIDTGASHSTIDDRLVAHLNLSATGTTSFHTPSTNGVPQLAATYDISMVFQNVLGGLHVIPILSVSSCHLASSGIDGLIGRDILAAARLTYSGPDNACFLSF